MGEATAADSVYMVGSVAKMPSGNALRLPVKVWRNRSRGNNQALVPTKLIDLNAEESEIRQSVLNALNSD